MKLLDAFTGACDNLHHGSRPACLAGEPLHRLHLGCDLVGACQISLVHDEDVGNLHNSRLQHLDAVAQAGHQHEHRHIHAAVDRDLSLSHAHRLDDDDLESGSLDHAAHGLGCGSEPARASTRGQAAHVNTRITLTSVDSDAIAEQRTAGQRTARVDRNDSNASPLPAQPAHHCVDQGALACASRTRHTDASRSPAQPCTGCQHQVGLFGAVFDDRDCTGKSSHLPALAVVRQDPRSRPSSYRACASHPACRAS